MNIFISYSHDDRATVAKVARAIKPFANSVHWWNKSKEPGKIAWQSIFKWIESSRIVLAIISKKTVKRAMAVGNEIGYARANDILVVPLIAPGVNRVDLGCLNGITSVDLDPKKK